MTMNDPGDCASLVIEDSECSNVFYTNSVDNCRCVRVGKSCQTTHSSSGNKVYVITSVTEPGSVTETDTTSTTAPVDTAADTPADSTDDSAPADSTTDTSAVATVVDDATTTDGQTDGVVDSDTNR
eukprot:UN05238